MKTPSYIPFRYRKFTLDGEPVDIETFISEHSNSFDEASILRADIFELPVGYDMDFDEPRGPNHTLHRLY